MSTKYLSNLTLIIAGAFLVVATQGFSLPVSTSLIFAMSIGFTVVGMGMLIGRPNVAQRVIGSLTGLLGVWTIVASSVFAPTTVLWLGFAAAIAFVILGIAGLTAHELTTERVVHSLAVEREPRSRREPVAA
jgi:sugar phosphate permease